MNDIFSTFQSVNQPHSMEQVVLNIVLACILAMLIAGVYRMTNRQRATSMSFLLTLIILSMVVALVMMVIGNSIARAFSLVGALSIIRFRTVVKDNRDIAYVFFALAAGMSAGISAWMLAVFGVGTILVLLMVLDFVRFGQTPAGLYLLRFQYLTGDTDSQTFEPLLRDLLRNFRRITMKTIRSGQYVEMTYLVRLKKDVSEERLISRLSALEGMERVSLLVEDDEVEV